MQTFDDISQARTAIMDFRADHFAAVPEHLCERFKTLMASPSPVDQICGVGEFIFANRDQLDAAAQELGAGLIAFANTNAWHGLLEDNRGQAIVANLRKDMGEISRAPAAPDAKFGFRVEEPASPAEPAAEPEA